jgi:hypothetical protein
MNDFSKMQDVPLPDQDSHTIVNILAFASTPMVPPDYQAMQTMHCQICLSLLAKNDNREVLSWTTPQ